MQPFLLAFVDSQFFSLIFWAIILLLALVAAVGIWVLAVLARRSLRYSRSLPTTAAWWQRLGALLLLLPAAFVGLMVLLIGPEMLLDDYRNRQVTTAFREALHQKEARLRLQVAGRYILADSVLSAPNPAWYADGWALADTTLLAADRANHGRPPRVELLLRPEGTFIYRSTIVGDAAGAQATGQWRLRERSEMLTLESVREMHDYTLVFDGPPLTEGQVPLSGSLVEADAHTTITLAGTYSLQGHSQSFLLRKAQGTLFQLAP